MERRQLLTAVGASTATALAGCLGSLSSAGSDPDRTYPALSVETDPAPGPATADVSVVREFDAEGPARVEITVTNAGEETLSAIFGAIPPWTNLWGEQVDGDAELLLIPSDQRRKRSVIPETATDDVWRATGDVGVNATAVMLDLSPGKRVTRTYAVLAGPDSEGLPAGDYRFEADDYLGIEPWGFTLSMAY